MNSEVVSESHAQYNGGKRLAGSAVACRAPAYGRRIGVLGIRAGIPATLETMLGRRLVAWLRPEEVRTTRDLLSEGADERVLAAACDLKQRGADTIALACSGFSTIGIAGEPLPRLRRGSLRTVTVCDFSAAPLVSPGPGRSRLPAGTRTSANLRHCAVALSMSAAHCMLRVVAPSRKEIPVVGDFSLLLSLCEWLWKCEKSWEPEQTFPQNNTGGRKRTPIELRARPEGRSSARTPGSSRTGPCPRRSRTYRRKGERLGCGITLGGLP